MPGELDNLRSAMFAAYADLTKRTPIHNEREQRQGSIDWIFFELLEGRPLESFSAIHLELLSIMFAFWCD